MSAGYALADGDLSRRGLQKVHEVLAGGFRADHNMHHGQVEIVEWPVWGGPAVRLCNGDEPRSPARGWA